MTSLETMLADARREGERLIGVVAGSGQVTRSAVEAGADVLFVLNAGLYRSLGVGSLASFLPFGNANDQTAKLLREQVLSRAGDVPVVAGVFAGDPTVPLDQRLAQLKEWGVAGVVNWPAIGFLDGALRAALEDDGFGVSGEAAMLEQARAAGLVTFGFALRPEEIRQLSSGADAFVLDLGLTRSVEDTQTKDDELHQAIARLNGMLRAVGEAGRQRTCFAYGGPVIDAEDVEQLLRHSHVHGLAGGSVFDRIPVADAVGATIRRFRAIAAGQLARRQEEQPVGMIGHGRGMSGVFALIRRAAGHNVNVYIEGESGTGKELVATQLHRLSRRESEPFVTLNCGAIPEGLLESELFGHERGAFTGAERKRLGKFELAHRGTLFLDEVADLSPRGQVALLRVLQQREVIRVGGDSPIGVDVRVLCASNRRLEELVESGAFRQDLYYRLAALTVEVPPLRSRLEDLPPLVEAVLAELRVQLGRPALHISPRFENKLRRHRWPGNVRELRHVITQAALREDGARLDGGFFVPRTTAAARSAEKIPRFQRRHLRAKRALEEARGNKSQAAASLGISRKTLYQWLREIG